MQDNTNVVDATPADPEERLLSKLPTLEGQFATKPEATRGLYIAFAAYAKEALDPADSGARYVELGRQQYNIQVAEFADKSVAYSRATVSENVKLSARIAGVPENLNRPHEFAQAFWLSKLDRSQPGENPGDPRSWSNDATPSEWFGGNVSYGTLRKLVPTMKRSSGDDELDDWDFLPEWEAWVRTILGRLRKGELSAAKVESLYRDRKGAIEKDARAARELALTPDEVKAGRDVEKNAERQQRLGRLSEAAIHVSREAATKLGYGRDELKRFLIDKGVITPDAILTGASLEGIASKMLPADGKALAQALITMTKSDPAKVEVIKAMMHEFRDAIKAARETEQGATVPLRKTGS